ncbi:phage tail protein [Marinilabiliaceae bacterium JC017]|nr:phage tail protein [Marinilabiliaceae bacterium JC017]
MAANFNSLYGNEDGYPPVAFYFSVSFPGNADIEDASFKEVSGISTEMDLESVEEGGENRFTYQLPKRIKHGNLVMKRGMTKTTSKLVKWVKQTLESGFSEAFVTKSIQVDLLNPSGEPLHTWLLDNAYPVKWDIQGFDSEKNEIVIETIEFAYNTIKRMD